nr:MAG TPA: hypothetical protein [Caudoviricetes sp.]
MIFLYTGYRSANQKVSNPFIYYFAIVCKIMNWCFCSMQTLQKQIEKLSWQILKQNSL